MASSGLRGDEADLFSAHHDRLIRAVRRRVNGPEALIEDAVANTWMVLLQVQPERVPTLFAWLVTVAEREAWRLAKRCRALASIDELGCQDMPEAASVEASVEAREQLEQGVLAMTARQRRIVGLSAAGYRHSEIAVVTGDSRRTIERQLQRGRKRARAATLRNEAR